MAGTPTETRFMQLKGSAPASGAVVGALANDTIKTKKRRKR